MILLWGVESDSPLAAVRDALQRRGAPTFFLDQSRAAETRVDFCSGDEAKGEIVIGDERCDLAKIGGVYVRGGDTASCIAGADETLTNHARQLDEALSAFLDVTRARVVNPLEAMASNGSKPYQLALIRAHGFATPDTLVTTEPAAVQAFIAQHGEVIYKSISGVRSIVSRLTPEHEDRLGDIVWCPTQFQQYVAGRDYRIHVVGADVFACEIVSDADDYRYASRAGEDVELRACAIHAPLAAQCRRLAASLGLPVAGIDLRLTPEGEWLCFEVNPSPAFTYYESETGMPIADAIAWLLVER